VVGSSIQPALENLRNTNRKLAEEIRSGAAAEPLNAARSAAADAAKASLETALTALELFEQWVQLETVIDPSNHSDFLAGRQEALKAARDALDTVHADLKSIVATRDTSSD
jgi:hypothetical protein